jgi:Nucleotidyl transferase AbiEii toxin, Type IV TA system
MQLNELVRLLGAFEKEQVDYVLIGGTAVNLHGIVRATEDVDIFLRPTADNVERLRRALRDVYDDPSIDEISADDLCGDYPAVRYYPPAGDLFLDILTRLGEFARFEDLEVQEVPLEGVRVRVASPRTLYWLKKGTVRPIDQADAAVLKEMFDIEESRGD